MGGTLRWYLTILGRGLTLSRNGSARVAFGAVLAYLV